jgi:hypothetical protein
MEQNISQKFPLSPKELFLVVIDVISVIILVFLLSQLPKAAEALREARITSTKDEASLTFEYDKTIAKKPDLDKLSALFLDDTGVVSFVNTVEKLKGEQSSIVKVTFTSQQEVKDRTGNYGIPVVIEMSGSWDQIGNDMEKLQVLPFLYRPVTFESKPNYSNPLIFDVKYGILLYVQHETPKN